MGLRDGSGMGLEQHRYAAPPRVSVYVVTLSDTRDASGDTSGQLVRDTLQAAGHHVAGSCILREDAPTLEHGLAEIVAQPGFDVVIEAVAADSLGDDYTENVLAEYQHRRDVLHEALAPDAERAPKVIFTVVIDGGELPGVPSTVLDLTGDEPRVLREGAVPADVALAKLT